MCTQAYTSNLSLLITEVVIKGVAECVPAECIPCLVIPALERAELQ